MVPAFLARGPADQVLATDYAAWPQIVRLHAISPIVERTVPVDHLKDFVDASRGRSHDWRSGAMHEPLFPKLGVCSWKEWPWLLPYGSSVPLNLFDFCSPRMRLVLSAWIERAEIATLRFFPFVDYSRVNEYRFSTRTGALIRSVHREPHDGQPAARALAIACAPHLDPCLIDIATRADGSSARSTWVIEINPLVEGEKP